MVMPDEEKKRRRREVTRKYRETHRQQVQMASRTSRRKIYKSNQAQGLCTECGKAPIALGNKALCDACAAAHRRYYTDEVAQKRKAERKLLKAEMVREFGGACECCGETAVEFLTLDHIEGGGTQERLKLKRGGTTFYSWLKQRGWPKQGLRLLCFNCNCALGCYGYCPHREGKDV